MKMMNKYGLMRLLAVVLTATLMACGRDKSQPKVMHAAVTAESVKENWQRLSRNLELDLDLGIEGHEEAMATSNGREVNQSSDYSKQSGNSGVTDSDKLEDNGLLDASKLPNKDRPIDIKQQDTSKRSYMEQQEDAGIRPSVLDRVGVYAVMADATEDEKQRLQGVPFVSREGFFRAEEGDVQTGDTAAHFYVCYPYEPGIGMEDTLKKKAPFVEHLYGIETGRDLQENYRVKMKMVSGMAMIRIRLESENLSDHLTRVGIMGDPIYTEGDFQSYLGRWSNLRGNGRPIDFGFDRVMNTWQTVEFLVPPCETSGMVYVTVVMNGREAVMKTALPALVRGTAIQLNLNYEEGKLKVMSSWVDTHRSLLTETIKGQIKKGRKGIKNYPEDVPNGSGMRRSMTERENKVQARDRESVVGARRTAKNEVLEQRTNTVPNQGDKYLPNYLPKYLANTSDTYHSSDLQNVRRVNNQEKMSNQRRAGREDNLGNPSYRRKDGRGGNEVGTEGTYSSRKIRSVAGRASGVYDVHEAGEEAPIEGDELLVEVGDYLQQDGSLQGTRDEESIAVVWSTDGRHGKAVGLQDVPDRWIFSSERAGCGKVYQTLDGRKREGYVNPTSAQRIGEEGRVVFDPTVNYPAMCAFGMKDGYSLCRRLKKASGQLKEEDMLDAMRRNKGGYVPSVAEMAMLYCLCQGYKGKMLPEGLFTPLVGEYLTATESGEETFYMMDFTRGIVTGSYSKQFARMNLRLFYLF